MEWIHRLYNTWLTDFNWPTVQNHLNRHSHFIASIPDNNYTHSIHFTHTRSPNPNAIPLLLVHGWPGTFYEFDRVVDSFANPSSSSSSPTTLTTPSFHVIVPSLPGFCWSSPPPRRSWTLQDTARIFDSLMRSLGYTSYVVQGGDWGHFVARELGTSRYPACKAVHLHFAPVPLSEEAQETQTPREKKVEARCQDWYDNHMGYAMCMRTRPHTIGVALQDNPVGILTWVGEKYIEASNPAKYNNDPSWNQIILTQASLYYFSGCIMTSMLPYYENLTHAEFGRFQMAEENKITVPLGYTSFFWDTEPGTKRGVERTGNLLLNPTEVDRV
jgi:pimeloyl-ACP methyl ester carboxylesterase